MMRQVEGWPVKVARTEDRVSGSSEIKKPKEHQQERVERRNADAPSPAPHAGSRDDGELTKPHPGLETRLVVSDGSVVVALGSGRDDGYCASDCAAQEDRSNKEEGATFGDSQQSDRCAWDRDVDGEPMLCPLPVEVDLEAVFVHRHPIEVDCGGKLRGGPRGHGQFGYFGCAISGATTGSAA